MVLHQKLRSSASVDLQLLLYVLGVAEALLYGLAIVTYAGALVAFNKALLRVRSASGASTEEDLETSRLLEVEALIQIFGIAIFFVVSLVMVGGVKENDHNKLMPYLLLCVTQVTVIVIYSIFIYSSWIFGAFFAIKCLMFVLTYTLYRRLVQDDELRRACIDVDDRGIME